MTKCANDRTAEHHRSSMPSWPGRCRLDVADRPRGAFDRGQLNRRPDMKQDGNQKHDARAPEQFRSAVKRFRIVVHHLRAQKNLKISQHVERPGSRKVSIP